MKWKGMFSDTDSIPVDSMVGFIYGYSLWGFLFYSISIDSSPAWVKGNASFFISRFTREGRKILVAFPFPDRSGPPLSEDLQVTSIPFP